VLALWSGLGYYSRARNLHRSAQIVLHQHEGKFPQDTNQINALPGIGRSTAAAISALAFHQPSAILDGNVKRVLARYSALKGYTGEKKIEQQLWLLAEKLLPHHEVATYTQGMMDLGAQVCTRSKPKCEVCPLVTDCAAFKFGLVDTIPTPRPRKVLPQKTCTFLLLLDGPDIFLEKRPATGIWGGLWCFPQINQGENIAKYCAHHFELDTAPIMTSLPVLTHTFTHFKLHITPLIIRINCRSILSQQPGKLWLKLEDALQAAIPAPVRTLVESLLIRPDYV
jgi:A/G-specific adenine glycosylase